MSAPRRGPRLVRYSEHAFGWEWPDDPENRAEDERIAAVYERERQKKAAEYAAKRAQYLRDVEAGNAVDAIRACPECGDPVYGGDDYCSPECMTASDRRPVAVPVHGRIAGRLAGSAGVCPVCNRRVLDRSNPGQARVYCSTRCARTAKKKRYREKIKRQERQTA